jgi:hypothetical protein
MRKIQLSRGYVALVDDEDYRCLSEFRWTTLLSGNDRVYAVRFVGSGELRKCIYMHREIMSAPDGIDVDHKVHLGPREKAVDNRRSNLRLASRGDNLSNRGKSKCTGESRSRFKGVVRVHGSWHANIKIRDVKKRLHLGAFASDIDAALAYDAAAVKYRGEFAYTNFPIEGSNRWVYDSIETAEELT